MKAILYLANFVIYSLFPPLFVALLALIFWFNYFDVVHSVPFAVLYFLYSMGVAIGLATDKSPMWVLQTK